MAISRVTTWAVGDVLRASALNGELNNILDNALALISPLTGSLNVNAQVLANAIVEFESYTAAGLPAAAAAGRVVRQSNGTRGLWMDTGAAWFSVTGDYANVKDFGARGDDATDDRLAIVDAVAALPATNGVLFFPPGIYYVDSASPIVNLSSRIGVSVVGAGRSATQLKQVGAGNGITGATLDACTFRDFSINGNNAAAKGIVLGDTRDTSIQDVIVSGFLNHGIEVTGANSYMITVERCKITAALSGTIAAGARGFAAAVGNGLTLNENYFNIGGTNTNVRYETAIDVVSAGRVITYGNWFDGCTTGIRASGGYVSLGDNFDGNATTGVTGDFWVLTTNNMKTIIGPTGASVTMAKINHTGMADKAYLHIFGLPDSGGLVTTNLGVTIGHATTTGAAKSDLILANANALLGVNAAGTNTVGLIGVDASNDVVLIPKNNNGTGRIKTGDLSSSYRFHVPIIASGSLPAAAAAENGALVLEDVAAGDRNLIIYAGGQRFRIDGGAAF